ncbi:MAG: carboxylate-amine ligase [Hyphomicrobiaceae bacterium]|nr:carboxylate-amine ligase [Hyphomicrobiaceae bacterium]
MEFAFGIEEEFFVVHERTLLIEPTAHDKFIERASQLAGGGINRELLQSQVEAATPVCSDFDEARAHVKRLRSGLARAGNELGLSVISAGTHPTAEWPEQVQTPKERYDEVVDELQLLAFRNLVCGLHVHVGLPDNEMRLSVMRRSIPFLPILLALSCSSPFWRGMSSGFASYRLTSYEELPRTGLPPLFSSWSEYEEYTRVLEAAGIIRNPSYIWWAIRPSHKYPTLELRIPDACTNVEDTLTIAALYRCLVRALALDPTINAGLTSPERALAKENKWRVQRYGLGAALVDPFREQAASIPAPEAARRLRDLVRPHAEALGAVREIERVDEIIARGNSADQQLAVYREAIGRGLSQPNALAQVKAWLQTETVAGC